VLLDMSYLGLLWHSSYTEKREKLMDDPPSPLLSHNASGRRRLWRTQWVMDDE
jgi:hypothetical protein